MTNRLTKGQKSKVRLLEPYFTDEEIADRLGLTPLEVRFARQRPETTPDFQTIYQALRVAKRVERLKAEQARSNRRPAKTTASTPLAEGLEGKTLLEALTSKTDAMCLSVRAQNTLQELSVEYVYQLALCSQDRILQLKKLGGRKVLRELNEAMSDVEGLKLDMSPEDPMIIRASEIVHSHLDPTAE